MKKFLILLFLMPIFLFSCSKDINTDTTEIVNNNTKQISTEQLKEESKNFFIKNEEDFNQNNFDKDLESLFIEIFE